MFSLLKLHLVPAYVIAFVNTIMIAYVIAFMIA
jgi:hypothetical protein